MFFRCRDLIVEIAHDLEAGVSFGSDRLWGLSWRAPDAGAVRGRLHAAELDVSCWGAAPIDLPLQGK